MDLTESYLRVLPDEILTRYEICETRDAAAVVQNTNPEEFAEIVKILSEFHLTREDIVTPGGSKGKVATRLDNEFRELGWREGRYDREITSKLRLMPYRAKGEKKAVEKETTVLSEGYKVDNVKGKIALDIEWHAKDGNLDRDVGAYRALYDVGIIAAGVVVTRSYQEIRDLALRLGRDAFGTTTTTTLDKLEPRMTRGDAGGCPILAFGITSRCMAE
ncbi:MAG TPA: BglII/BstYI family type II restriction endonuclease [Solirubrobacterales bacterium]|nr:BglII/BstYI family type II restriction endonuclease [Solirubrobacterales bacterium]